MPPIDYTFTQKSIMINAYKKAYTSLFSDLVAFTNEAMAKANAISEVHIQTQINETVYKAKEVDIRIVALLTTDMTYEEIGKQLEPKLAKRTVEGHVKALHALYGSRRTAQLVAIFFRNGWIK